MSDFNWDDYENNDDGLFNNGDNDGDDKDNERLEWVRKSHRLMFIDDLEKFQYQSVPLDPIEFTDMFGKPTTEDLEIITQVFIKDYLLWSDKEDENLLYNKWGGDWIMELLKFNEDREEYELCSIMLESYKKCNRYFKTMYNKNKVK